MGIFRHTASEPGMWRGWLHNDQCLELHMNKRGWDFGAGILIHTNDADQGDRMLCLKFWRFSAYIPLGIVPLPDNCHIGDEPQWSAFGSSEFGLRLHWDQRRWQFDWPGTVFTVAYEMQLPNGSWVNVFDRTAEPRTEVHPYHYVLKSGEVQARTATISKRRHRLARKWLHRIGWPKWVKESIDIEFSDEIGERSGSWKGGCIGCSYDLLDGETMLDALRRMERERKFA